MRFGFSRSWMRSVRTQRCDSTSLTDRATASNRSRAPASTGSMTSSNSRCRSYRASVSPEKRIGPHPYRSRRSGIEFLLRFGYSAAAVCQFQCYQAGYRYGEIEWLNNRFQIGQAAGEGIERHDGPVTSRSQCGEAKIQHGRDFLRTAHMGGEIGKGAGAQLPDQAVGRGKNRCEAQINYDCTLKAMKCDTTRSVDGMRYHPGQRGEGKNFTAAAQQTCPKPG